MSSEELKKAIRESGLSLAPADKATAGGVEPESACISCYSWGCMVGGDCVSGCKSSDCVNEICQYSGCTVDGCKTDCLTALDKC